jgi:broad specificity phosphatase PhoE
MSDRNRTVVHVMRHGEVHNPEGILYGRLPDYHLSERGRAQASAVARSCAAV